jgi:hypothetical protein
MRKVFYYLFGSDAANIYNYEGFDALLEKAKSGDIG